MGWGQNTPTLVCTSAQDKSNIKVRSLATAGMGILLVFCLPGQISKASYTSETTVAMADVLPAAPAVNVNPIQTVRDYTPSDGAIATKRLIPNKPIAEKSPPLVQLASLNVDLPRLEKPKDFLPPQSIRPMPQNPVYVRPEKPRPKLEKKLFGTVELRFDDERKIKAWSSVYYKFLGDTQTLKTCLNNRSACSDPALAEWASKLQSLRNLSTYDKISAVNSMANSYTYYDDRRNYGMSDYWAGPREFLTRGGDCEDYALLKFASLLALGVDEQDMRLVVGRLVDGTPHAFLATNIGQQEFILDNRQSQVYLTQNRKDYIPKYSMNLSYRWSHVVPGGTNI
jgi:predicted transglutaminase-like cysteine proteinase